MCRPLKDRVTELEAKYKGHELMYTLNERSLLIEEYDRSMEHLLQLMDAYIAEVNYTLGHNLNPSIISHITQNLIIHLIHVHDILMDYSVAITMYLMDERYDNNYKYWEEFENKSKCIKTLVGKLEDNCIFNIEDVNPDQPHQKKQSKDGFGELVPNQFYDENEHSCLNGALYLRCLCFMLDSMEEDLTSIKLELTYKDDYSLEEFFELNYLLYAKKYWPERVVQFRQHVKKYFLNGESDIESLKSQRHDALMSFGGNSDPGRIWRDYSEDTREMAFQMKLHKLDENQWRYFFQNIFEIEEYDRWIDELCNPPENEEEKKKRTRLLGTNKVFVLQPAKTKKKVDILLLYNYIDTRFISETKFVYEWYALYYILMRNGIINTCTMEDFAKQMNDKEWFAHVNKKCKANEINSYRFLNDKAPDFWEKVESPHGNRASKKALKNIFRRYLLLNDSLDEIYEK